MSRTLCSHKPTKQICPVHRHHIGHYERNGRFLISYEKLFHYLKENNISKTAFAEGIGISSATMAKLSKNETVSLTVIIDICNYFHCQPGDIMENLDEVKEDSLLHIFREEKEHKIKGGIYHQTQVQLAYNSNHMEGSTLSEEQTRYIYETNTIGLENTVSRVTDIIETVNHFDAFDFIIEHATDSISEDFIKKVHSILKCHTEDAKLDWFRVGEYKARPNSVGGRETVAPELVETEMKKLISAYHKKLQKTFQDLLEFHVRFEEIHPFQDGNGRVGRLILFKECLKYNFVPFIIFDDKKLFYYRGLREYRNDTLYLTDTCLSFQDEYKNVLRYFKIKVTS